MTQIVTKSDVLVKLAMTECYKCGVLFGMPQRMHENLMETHDTFYCPCGHGQRFAGDTEVERLRKIIAKHDDCVANLKKREEWAIRSKELAEHDAKVASSRTKATITITRKLRARIKNGTCPC